MAGRHRERTDVVGDVRSRSARRSRPGPRSAGRRAWPSAGGASGRSPAVPCARRRTRPRCRRRRLLAGQKPTTAFARSRPLADDPLEQRERVAVEVARRGAETRVVEDRRVGAAQLPGREERRPVDERDELGERIVVERAQPEEGRTRRRDRRPVDRHVVGAGLGDGQPLLLGSRPGALAADRLVLVADPGHERVAPVGLDQGAGDADGARRIDDVDDRARVGRRDLDRGVGPRRRRAADQQRDA